MRKNFTLAAAGLLVLAASTAMAPNYSVKRTGTLARGGYFIYYTTQITNATRADIRGFSGPLLSQVCSDVQPRRYTTGYSVDLYPGAGTSLLSQNGRCEITFGPYPGSPNAAAATEDYNSNGSSGSSYYEFDIVIPSGNGFTYGDGYGNYVDRKSVLRHEFSHGIGLGHSRSPSTLMYKAMSTNQVKSVDQDVQDGFRCIYDNVCGGNECGSGAVEVVQGQSMRDSRTALTWSVPESRQDIKGFNVYRKRGSTYEAINSTLIKALAGAPDYAFALPQGQSFKDGTYFLEVLLTHRKGSASFTAFKS